MRERLQLVERAVLRIGCMTVRRFGIAHYIDRKREAKTDIPWPGWIKKIREDVVF
jgi:hypothetical protein